MLKIIFLLMLSVFHIIVLSPTTYSSYSTITDKETLSDDFRLRSIDDIILFETLSDGNIIAAFFLDSGEAVLKLVYIQPVKQTISTILDLGAAGRITIDYNEKTQDFIMYWIKGFHYFSLFNKNGRVNQYNFEGPAVTIPYGNIDIMDLYWISNDSFVVEYYPQIRDADLVKDTLYIPEKIFEEHSKTLLKARIYHKNFTLNSGIETDLIMELCNVGGKALTNIRVSSSEQPSIKISFDPLTFDSLGVGSSEYFAIKATPIKTILKKVENIIVTFSADNYENRQEITIVVLSPKNYWIRIGIIFSLFVIILFIVIHIKLKKREKLND